MSHTIRRYNLPGYLFWHPWHQHPSWHLRQDPTGRRGAIKEELNGILAGLKDFCEGRCKHFKNDEELEEYLMSL
jgi:hypothetical protein